MSQVETEQFRASMLRWFQHAADEIYGPIYGPGGPRMRGGDAEGVPDPIPWRELVSAFEAVKLADAFEMAAPGTGVAFVEKFADDPDKWCGTRGPGWPLPKDPGRLDRPTLGAALELVARGLSDDRLAVTVREAGQRILG